MTMSFYWPWTHEIGHLEVLNIWIVFSGHRIVLLLVIQLLIYSRKQDYLHWLKYHFFIMKMKKIHLKLKAYHKIWLNKTSLFIWICFTKSPELRAMFVRFVKTFCCLYGNVNTGICRKPLTILILILVSFFLATWA